MSRRTKTPSRTQSTIVLGREELEARGLELGERLAGAVAGDFAPAARSRELSPGLIDEALDRARIRTAAGELAGGGRISDAVIDELLAGARIEQEMVGPGGLFVRLTKRLVERVMEVELSDHLGYEPHLEPAGGAGNTRNGTTAKTLVSVHGKVAVDAPRDRNGSFKPPIVRKRQRRFQGFDDRILALYSRGLSTRDIEAHIEEIYGVKVGRELISKVTDAVMDDVRAWAQRPLGDVYPVVFLNAMVLKIRENGSVHRRACYLALGSRSTGSATCSACGFRRPRARSSGSRSSLTSSSAASETS